eukprot:scaffold10383_cov117-Isochrysis_galbana.AAC.4
MASRSGERYARRSRRAVEGRQLQVLAKPYTGIPEVGALRVPAIEGWEVSNMTSGTLAEGRSRRYHVKPSPCDRWER